MNSIELSRGGVTVAVNPIGASVDSMVLEATGEHLLLPRQTQEDGLTILSDGGLRPLVPVVGTDATQQIVGQEVPWDAIKESDDKVSLSLEVDKRLADKFGLGSCLGIVMRLVHTLPERMHPTDSYFIDTELTLENGGEVPMVVRPGILAYFGLGDKERATSIPFSFGLYSRHGSMYSEEQLRDSVVSDEVRKVELRSKNRRVVMRNFQLGVTAVSTDNPETHVRVESASSGLVAAGQGVKTFELEPTEPNNRAKYRSMIAWIPMGKASHE